MRTLEGRKSIPSVGPYEREGLQHRPEECGRGRHQSTVVRIILIMLNYGRVQRTIPRRTGWTTSRAPGSTPVTANHPNDTTPGSTITAKRIAPPCAEQTACAVSIVGADAQHGLRRRFAPR